MTRKSIGAARSVCVLGAIILGGLAAAPAAAGQGGHPARVERVTEAGYGGTLQIGARSFRISAYGDVCVQLVDAFQRAGHRAWIENGRVRVEWCGVRPSVSWSSGRWTMTISLGRGSGWLTPSKPSARPVYTAPVKRGSWGRWGDRRRDRWHRTWRR